MADSQLDILIKASLEAQGFRATEQAIAGVKQQLEGLSPEVLKGFDQGVQQATADYLRLKEAVIDQAIGQAMQRDAAVAEAAVKKQIESLDEFESAKRRQIAEFKKGEADSADAARRATVLGELTRNQVADTKATEDNTQAKKQQTEALRGLSRAFPALAETIRAVLSPLGLLTAAFGAAVSVVMRHNAYWREAAARTAELRREIELLHEVQKSGEAIRQSVLEDYERAAAAIARQAGELDNLTAALDRQTASITANRQINEQLDDEILRAEMLRIDGLDEPESNKNLLRSRATQQARDRREQARIKAQADDARRTEEASRAAADLAARKEAEAAALNPEIARLTEAKQAADTAAKEQAAVTELPLAAIEDEIRQIMAALLGGGDSFSLPGRLGTASRDEAKARLAQLREQAAGLRGGVSEAQGMAGFSGQQLADAQARQQALLAEAAAARARSGALQGSAAQQSAAAAEAQRGFDLVGPWRQRNDATENQRAFQAQFVKELQARVVEAAETNRELARLLMDFLKRSTGDTAELRKFMADMAERLNRQRPIQ